MVRRHARHVMMMVMTMMGTNLHLIFTLGEEWRDVNCGRNGRPGCRLPVKLPERARPRRVSDLVITRAERFPGVRMGSIPVADSEL